MGCAPREYRHADRHPRRHLGHLRPRAQRGPHQAVAFPEAVWAGLGATTLVGLGLLPWSGAWRAIGKGSDVYLFLTGMMLLAELARCEGLFDWLAALAAQRAHGSAQRLFALVYGVGTVVTVFLSNDATAIVLTPAVYAVTKAARVTPLPYLLVCAFIANAASFVLPISNPANLVIFGRTMPPLTAWLGQFALPSVLPSWRPTWRSASRRRRGSASVWQRTSSCRPCRTAAA